MVVGRFQFGIGVVWSINNQGSIDSESKFGVCVRRLDNVAKECTVLLKMVQVMNDNPSRSKKLGDKQYFAIKAGEARGWSPSFSGSPNGIKNLLLEDVLDSSKGWLHDGALRVTCKLSVVMDILTAAPLPSDRSPQQEVCDALGNLLFSRDFADVTIKVGGEQIEAHSAILAARSPVFSAMFQSPMKESQDKQVPLEDLDAHAVRAMITFLYTGSVDADMLDNDDSALALLHAAHRFEVLALVDQCTKTLGGRLDVSTVAEWLQVADLINCTGFRAQCLDFMRQNMPEVQMTDAYNRLVTKRPALLMDVVAALAPPAKRMRAAGEAV